MPRNFKVTQLMAHTRDKHIVKRTVQFADIILSKNRVSRLQLYRKKDTSFHWFFSTNQYSYSFQQDANLTPEEKILEQITAAETEQRLIARRKFLAERCAEEGLDRPGNDSLHRPNAWEFLVNREYHLIWCNVFKAASTSWMYNFNLLAG